MKVDFVGSQAHLLHLLKQSNQFEEWWDFDQKIAPGWVIAGVPLAMPMKDHSCNFCCTPG